MRIPNPNTYRRWFRYLMVFFLGVVLGVLIQLLFVGKELDRLHLQIDSLKNENISLLDDVKRFEEERAKARKSQNLVVEHLEVHIMDPKPDQFTETELIRLVKEDTKYLIGKKLETINDLHLSVRQQFKGRTYEVKDALVQTELRAMTIYTTVHLHIYAKPLPQTP